MRKKKTSIEADWTNEKRFFWTGKHHRIDHDVQIPKILLGIDEQLEEVAKARGRQFYLGKGPRGHTMIRMNKVAEALVKRASQLNPHIVRRYATRHEFSPYFTVWERVWHEAITLVEVIRRNESLDAVNEWFDALRAEVRAAPFLKATRNQRRVARKNAASLRTHINQLFRDYSRLLVMRIDFGYRHEPDFDVDQWVPPSDRSVKADFVRLKRFIKANVPHLLSIIWKVEYGAIKGPHLHAILICDGHEVRQGITWGKVVGEKWEEITNGAGVHWNCNAHQALFEKMGRRGIGLIDYTDEARRDELMRVAMYVAKADSYMRFISPDIGRTFGKSINKASKGKKGRPRKYVDPVEGGDGAEDGEKVA